MSGPDPQRFSTGGVDTAVGGLWAVPEVACGGRWGRCPTPGDAVRCSAISARWVTAGCRRGVVRYGRSGHGRRGHGRRSRRAGGRPEAGRGRSAVADAEREAAAASPASPADLSPACGSPRPRGLRHRRRGRAAPVAASPDEPAVRLIPSRMLTGNRRRTVMPWVLQIPRTVGYDGSGTPSADRRGPRPGDLPRPRADRLPGIPDRAGADRGRRGTGVRVARATVLVVAGRCRPSRPGSCPAAPRTCSPTASTGLPVAGEPGGAGVRGPAHCRVRRAGCRCRPVTGGRASPPPAHREARRGSGRASTGRRGRARGVRRPCRWRRPAGGSRWCAAARAG